MEKKAISNWWQKFSSRHQNDLEEFGFENFKRHQNFHYFNWNWEWGYLFKPQMKFLFSHTTPREWVKAVPNIFRAERFDRSDARLYQFGVGLLWLYAKKHDELGLMELPEPTLGNPPPVHMDGRLISQDLANTSLELNWLLPFINPPRRVIEVGAGGGRTAYVLLSTYEDLEYTIVDIEPTLSISKRYLSTLFPHRKLRFIDAGDIDMLAGEKFDLGLTISSIQEMTPENIKTYLDLFDRSADFIYIKQYKQWFNNLDGFLWKFDEMGIPKHWRLVSQAECPVQTYFKQAVWEK